MSKRKIQLILVLIWIAIFVALVMLDAFVLRYPVNGEKLATYRLIPPFRCQFDYYFFDDQFVNYTMQERLENYIFPNLGYPNEFDSSTGTLYWDLQFGKRLTAEHDFHVFDVTPIFSSARWLIFPGIMICVALIELLVYRRILRSR